MSEVIVVTGATGQQGGAVARALLAAGRTVHGLVRDPQAAAALALAELGVHLVTGDLDDPASLRAALDGAGGLFSVQTPDFSDLAGGTELQRARNLAAAAARAGVQQVVHTSASGVTRLVDTPRWGEFVGHVFRIKTASEDALRDVGAKSFTVLRPSTFMENFLHPSYFYAEGRDDRVLVAYDLDVPQPFVAVADIAAAAAAAFADPAGFHCVELELAGDRRSVRDAVAVLSRAWGREITLPDSVEQALEEGLPPIFLQTQGYLSARPAPAFPEVARAHGLPTTTIEEWAGAVR